MLEWSDVHLLKFTARQSLPWKAPLVTSIKDNILSELDPSTVDQKTRLIRKRVESRAGQDWAQPEKVLSAEQVAEVVMEVILSENPNLRYQTNKQYCPDEIAAKLADITGNKSVDIIAKRFCAE
ncbi:hypothetical protein OS493_007993 [Desmophyllum pertusum]|uniref:Uncharacterized protein n=1 Tax=Desmophyllum pertusum TaxID=174260 RepID=A0A9X0CGA6_9CNID|nr:hypothetical protein OS493_007993 [Desmophyllum pertusum]